MHTETAAIAEVFLDFYKELLVRKAPHRTQAYPSFFRLGPILTIAEQMQLIKPYTGEDVTKALFGIDSTKSPGPDGYGSDFFKKSWCIIGTNVMCCSSCRIRSCCNKINATVISLIPKVPNP